MSRSEVPEVQTRESSAGQQLPRLERRSAGTACIRACWWDRFQDMSLPKTKILSHAIPCVCSPLPVEVASASIAHGRWCRPMVHLYRLSYSCTSYYASCGGTDFCRLACGPCNIYVGVARCGRTARPRSVPRRVSGSGRQKKPDYATYVWTRSFNLQTKQTNALPSVRTRYACDAALSNPRVGHAPACAAEVEMHGHGGSHSTH